jgi:hypothetical protein
MFVDSPRLARGEGEVRSAQEEPLYWQSGTSQNCSPITPVVLVPFSEIPGREIDPSDVSTKCWHAAPPPKSQYFPELGAGFFGSRFGMTQGFTQRGCTGMMLPLDPFPTSPELEGLNASAVAVALTLFPVFFPQMREKKVGKPVCLI